MKLDAGNTVLVMLDMAGAVCVCVCVCDGLLKLHCRYQFQREFQYVCQDLFLYTIITRVVEAAIDQTDVDRQCSQPWSSEVRNGWRCWNT